VCELDKKLSKSIRLDAEKEELVLEKKASQNTDSNEGVTESKIDRILVQWSSFVKIKKKNYLDDYIFIKNIGVGAFGAVSKIKMKYGGLYRAAKKVKTSAITQRKIKREQFVAEITIPLKIDHPNINKLFEVFEWHNQYVLIMELCEGGDLFSYMKSQRSINESKIAEIMEQVFSGVVYLHKNNIVHRDLKPENMLYDTESKLIKIIDFGSAIELPNSKRLTSVVGTPYYIAPEVLAGEYNEKCDIWSCGVILYILLCGRAPFTGNSEIEVMENIRNHQVKFPGTHSCTVGPIWNKRSKECKRLVMQMLNKDYNERPNAVEVLNSEWIQTAVKHYHNDDLGIETLKHLNNFHVYLS
jgi:calcium-dependent protein kinase